MNFNPGFSTIRDWCLKLGLHKLKRPKQNEEYIYIIDSSIQMGSMKLLLMIGVPIKILLEKWKNNLGFTVTHEEVEVIISKPVTSCTGEIVRDALLEAEKKTGIPISIISDEGAEFNNGIKRYQSLRKNVIHSHDFIHRVNLLIGKSLEGDTTCIKIRKEITKTTQKIKLTEYSHLIAPKQRKKIRMLAELSIIEWCKSIYEYIETHKIPKKIKIKINWIKKYSVSIKTYTEISDISKSAIEEVHKNGYFRGMSELFNLKWLNLSLSDMARSFLLKIVEIMKEEEVKVPDQKRFLGTSEVIESIFGKFKYLEKNYSGQGLTSLILGLNAMLGETSEAVVKEALEKISIQDVRNWIQENLGNSFLSKKRADLKKGSKDHYLELDESAEWIA